MLDINILKNKNLLITGGTGSFGNAFVKHVIRSKIKINKLIIFSRDEYKQFEMSKKFSEDRYPFMRYFLGDIRDRARLDSALEDVDYIIHAAALKHVPIAEYNPFEFIKTNILGSQNVLESAMYNNCRAVVALSTDKASSPLNLYGATKLCSEKIFTSSNNIKGKNKIKFCVVRYGNVMGSRGSVLHQFIERKNQNKKLKITDKEMTRFNISLEEAINLTLRSLKDSHGGEIYIPKLKSFKITNLAKIISNKEKFEFIGIRPGEKIHEEMVSIYEGGSCYDIGKAYVIVPDNLTLHYNKKYKKMPNNFSYNSEKNIFLSDLELKKKVSEFINSGY